MLDILRWSSSGDHMEGVSWLALLDILLILAKNNMRWTLLRVFDWLIFLIFFLPVLATWFRLKYPHVALGALASSAPILYFDDITPQNGYYSVVTKDFRVIYIIKKFDVLFCYLIIKLIDIEKGVWWFVQEASETCYETIMKSWAEIEKVASKPDGPSILSKKFRTCK